MACLRVLNSEEPQIIKIIFHEVHSLFDGLDMLSIPSFPELRHSSGLTYLQQTTGDKFSRTISRGLLP